MGKLDETTGASQSIVAGSSPLPAVEGAPVAASFASILVLKDEPGHIVSRGFGGTRCRKTKGSGCGNILMFAKGPSLDLRKPPAAAYTQPEVSGDGRNLP